MDSLQYDICIGCGERSPMGIMELVTHQCRLNTFTYRSGAFKMRHFARIIVGGHPMQSFIDLLPSPYLKAMPDFDSASELDKKVFSYCREMDVAFVKRLWKHIDLEEDFDSKY